jgi:hypothetical protein
MPSMLAGARATKAALRDVPARVVTLGRPRAEHGTMLRPQRDELGAPTRRAKDRLVADGMVFLHKEDSDVSPPEPNWGASERLQ